LLHKSSSAVSSSWHPNELMIGHKMQLLQLCRSVCAAGN
jgi:hypothetical protein